MLFKPVLAFTLVSSLAGAVSATHLLPRSAHSRLLPRQAGSECTQTCQNAYDVVQDCYSSESDVEAIAACSCGDNSLSALQECATCAESSDLDDSDKSTITDGVADLVNQCEAAGLASTTLSNLPSASGSGSGSASASGSGFLSELESAASGSSAALSSVVSSAVESGSSALESASPSSADSGEDASSDNDDSSAVKTGLTSAVALALTGAMVVLA